MSDKFTPIPDYPGYSINARGQVMGKAGRLLSHDAQGTVQLVQGKTKRRAFPGELLLRAGWRRPDESGQSVAPAAEASIAELEAQLAQAQSESEFMRSRADQLEKRLDELALESVDAGKRTPKNDIPAPDALQALKARCKAAESLARKLETQRDNLAAKLLTMQVELADAKARAKSVSGRRAIGRADVIPEDWE